MDEALQKGAGMDVLVVSTSSKHQEEFWQRRLQGVIGDILSPHAQVIVIEEDWPGGAGNALGTLYTYQKARRQLQESSGIDLNSLQKKGAAIAIYHTAGKGARLSPLSLSEYNNKSAIKLPGLVSIKGEGVACITLLEAVIKQTSIYASSRKGRLSVFWGDQIFFPTKPTDYKPTHHIDILAKLSPMPSQKEWEIHGLDKYGLVTLDPYGNAQQIDKSDYATIQNLISSYKIQTSGGLGMSLGSFSLSYEMTEALLEEFSYELDAKTGKMDVETSVWMPCTLDEETYSSVMETKGVSTKESLDHHLRMQAFKTRFLDKFPSGRFFGAVDIGNDGYWWDYGTLDSYYHTNQKLLQNTVEAEMMRRFFRIKPEQMKNGSCILNCKIAKGRIRNSILIGVNAAELELDNCLIINSDLDRVRAIDSILYNVVEQESFALENQVRADLFFQESEQHFKIYTHQGRDGKEDWHKKMDPNPYSYSELYELCKNPKRQLQIQVHSSKSAALFPAVGIGE